MAVIIGGLVARSTVTDATSGYQLNGAFGVYALALGGRTFVYAAGLKDWGISVFELGADGSLTHVESLKDGPPTTSPLELAGVANFASATVDGVTYLYSNSSVDDGISVFRVGDDGTLTNVQNITDDSQLELNGSEGRMAVVTVEGATFLLATGDDDNGISVFGIGAGGLLTNSFNLTDSSALFLDNAMDVVTATMDRGTFAVVAGEDENGISVFQLHADGTLTFVQNIADDPALNLWGISGLATATVGATTYVLAAGVYDDGLSVFAMGADGQLANVSNISDTAARGLNGAQGLTVFTLDTETLVAVSGRDDDALTLFHLGADGTLTDVTAIFDDAGLTLDESHYNAFASVGGNPFLIAAGETDDGLTSFELGGGDDTLAGTETNDLLFGLAGNDTLDGGLGQDHMRGGSGDDDLTGGSGGDLLDGGVGSDTAHYESRIKVALNGSLSGSGDAAGDAFLSIENLTGSKSGDRLRGDNGANILKGEGGNDTLEGLSGDDTLDGDRGNDLLKGARGTDTLTGGRGNDKFMFMALKDSLPGADMDHITDFASGEDRILLTKIDADATVSGNQAFSLDTDNSFSTGEIRQTIQGNDLLLEFNSDGNSNADMAILLENFTHPLSSTDFEL